MGDHFKKTQRGSHALAQIASCQVASSTTWQNCKLEHSGCDICEGQHRDWQRSARQLYHRSVAWNCQTGWLGDHLKKTQRGSHALAQIASCQVASSTTWQNYKLEHSGCDICEGQHRDWQGSARQLYHRSVAWNCQTGHGEPLEKAPNCWPCPCQKCQEPSGLMDHLVKVQVV